MVPWYRRMGQTLWTAVRTYMQIVHVSTFSRIPIQSYGTAGQDRHSGQRYIVLCTCMYIPKDSYMVLWYSRMERTLWTVVHRCTQYMLVHSQGFLYGPIVQQDRTDTQDSGTYIIEAESKVSKECRDHWMRPLTDLEYSNGCHATINKSILNMDTELQVFDSVTVSRHLPSASRL